jgi:hypothetical protein
MLCSTCVWLPLGLVAVLATVVCGICKCRGVYGFLAGVLTCLQACAGRHPATPWCGLSTLHAYSVLCSIASGVALFRSCLQIICTFLEVCAILHCADVELGTILYCADVELGTA